MLYLIIKYLMTAGVVVAVSEAAKRNDQVGALIASLPLVTVLTLIWLHVEQQPMLKISNHAYYTFWYVLPTLPMFLLFPYVLPRLGCWVSRWVSAVLTAVLFALLTVVMRRFGVML